MRTLVDLPEEDLALLKRLGDAENVSRTELVRRAVSDYLRVHRTPHPLPGFGIWRDRPVDGMEFQDRIRKEWDRGEDE